MSKFLHDDADADVDDNNRAVTIPRHFLQKQPSLKEFASVGANFIF